MVPPYVRWRDGLDLAGCGRGSTPSRSGMYTLFCIPAPAFESLGEAMTLTELGPVTRGAYGWVTLTASFRDGLTNTHPAIEFRTPVRPILKSISRRTG